MEFAVAGDEVRFSVFDVLPQTEEASGDAFVREVKIPNCTSPGTRATAASASGTGANRTSSMSSANS
ncbi:MULTISPECIES: hypothetical protein [Amycolatopsis]|uniref:hypothetical protein n=1 Tax=Amycolatopsis TaxID=1813 RepID=UPI0007DEEB27|nr:MULTISPECIES: hypothetical protein [Amycolatopsis]OAP24428.1 hypothetical protein A4R44_04819 [Amycolatopsis sp. M39]